MVENPYLQFPLCALSFGATADVRLNAILDYSVVEAGSQLFQKLSLEKQREFQRGKMCCRRNPDGINPYDWRHTAAAYGAHIIGVTYRSFIAAIETHAQLHDYVDTFAKAHGRDALVRIKKDWLFKARDGHGLTYREFSVLCAIYSAIGDKKLAIVTRERIRHCALGYRSAAIMQAELPRRADGAQPLTERPLRDTVARLHRNKFFAHCIVARRLSYFSIRLDHDALRKTVLERRTYREFFHANQSAQDRILTAAIKRKYREIAQSEPKPPPSAPRFKFPPFNGSH